MKSTIVRYQSVVATLCCLFLFISPITAKDLDLESLVITNSGGNKIEYKIEVARTPLQMQRGLMFRDTMPEDRGMLFSYNPERPAAMWMKNTILSLDMVFINSEGVIINIRQNTIPFSLETIDSGGSVRAVLELNAGQTMKHQIMVGDRVSHPVFEEPPVPQQK